MIALQHERAFWFFVQPVCRASGARHFDIFVNQRAIVDDFDELRVLGFLSVCIKARCAKDDVERLPFARGFADVD